jgi:hypothetical protein
MKAVFILIVIIIVPIAFLQCSDMSTSSGLGSNQRSIASPDGEIKIAYDESVFIESENLTILFDRVIGDSRCPSGVVCFWEGQAEIRLTLRKSGQEPVDVVLKIRPGRDPEKFPELTVKVLGYRISLVALEPYPDIECPRVIEDYEALLIIE